MTLNEIRPRIRFMSRWKRVRFDAKTEKYNVPISRIKEVNASHTNISSYSLQILEPT